MKAAVYHRFGGPEVVTIEEVPTPVPGENDVLVRVHATTVSIADHRARAKDLPPGLGLLGSIIFGTFRPKVPVLGMDYAGVIETVGSAVTTFAPGDRVYGLRGAKFGGHAQYVVALAAGSIVPAPQGWTHEDAVALLFGGSTALAFLDGVGGGVGDGDAVLINGASGATGSMAVQIAASRGAIVTGVSSAVNHPLVSSLGAHHVIDYATQDFAAVDAAYDVVMDCVGNAPFARANRSLKPGGTFLPVISDLRGMLRNKGQAKRNGKKAISSSPTITPGLLNELTRLAEIGAIRPVIDSTVDLDDIVAAHTKVDTGRKRGAVVVRIE
jgi:NADPH:quinone reductase-like Zn-dependent oxidoreductase